ncbi:MAG: hypothetical protein HW389_2594 [Bacteroidetes bacterium]|nr:hypothetical protein [Bacteroidota bacterium]
MKLPSFDQIFRGAIETLFRFPLVLCSAVAGTVSALILVDHEGPESPTVLFKILFASILGVSFLLGLALFAEKKSWSRSRSLGIQLAGVALLVGYAFTVPSVLASGPAFHIERLLVLSVATLMFVSVAPFLNSGEQNGFWHYNKALIFRILGSALYSHILYLGLCLALAALDKLFGFDIPAKRYGELWIITFGILNTWLFLAGIPGDMGSLEKVTEFPKSLRILVQYALGPLAVVYLVIVYAYIAKIMISWEWPVGWVSSLILGFSVTGMLSIVLMHPVREGSEAGWVKGASRWLYIAMIPLVIVFPLALWRRISEYGITEARYTALVLAAWLIFIVLYFLFSKSKSIKAFPASLGLVSLAVAYGPWGMFDISEHDQVRRLREILVRDSILVESALRKPSGPVSQADSKQISSILSYLHEVHGFEGIRPWFGQSLHEDSSGASQKWKSAADVAGMLGVEFVRTWPGGGGNMATFTMNADVSIDVKGFDRMKRFQYVDRGGFKKEIAGEAITFEFTRSLDTLAIRNMVGGGGLLQIELHSIAAGLLKAYANESVGNVPPEKMTVGGVREGLKVKVFVRNMQVRRRGETIEVNNISADIYYSK